MPSLAQNSIQKFTYADYLNWPDDERWEIIRGMAYDMSQAPGKEHQQISFRLSGILYGFLKDKSCEAFAAPFDVRLAEVSAARDENIQTVGTAGYCRCLRSKQARQMRMLGRPRHHG